MATYGLDVECPHIVDGTHFAQWKNWMIILSLLAIKCGGS
jgi:hypothetical protein